MGESGSEELMKCPLTTPTVLWFVNVCERKPRWKNMISGFAGFTQNTINFLKNLSTIHIMKNWWNRRSDNLGEVWVQLFQDLTIGRSLLHLPMLFKSGRLLAFLGKVVLKICSKFTGEHQCRSAISIKLLCKWKSYETQFSRFSS